MGTVALFILTIAAIVFSAGGILASRFFTKSVYNPQKGQPYECGIPTSGTPWSQFHIGYYLYAIVFLLFEVELVFMYPWAVIVQKIGVGALVEMFAFITVLFIGFLYAHKKGALKWM